MNLAYPPSNTPLIGDDGQLNSLWSAFFDSIFAFTNSTPPGSVFAFAGVKIPDGFLPCDGRALSKLKFSALYDALGSTYGSDGGNFNIPNYTGKFVRGSDTAGQTGGADNVTLTLDTLPDVPVLITDPGHTHTFTPTPHTHVVDDPQHSHGGVPSTAASGAGSAGGFNGNAGTTAPASTGITLENALADGAVVSAPTGVTAELKGGGKPVGTVPSFISVVYIIKT